MEWDTDSDMFQGSNDFHPFLPRIETASQLWDLQLFVQAFKRLLYALCFFHAVIQVSSNVKHGSSINHSWKTVEVAHTHHIWVRGEIFIDFSLIQNSDIEWWTMVNHVEPWWTCESYFTTDMMNKNSCTSSQERRLFGPLGPALGPESSSWVLSPEINVAISSNIRMMTWDFHPFGATNGGSK